MPTEKPAACTTLLELHVPDFKKVKEYYSKLSFKEVWTREPEKFKGYLVMKMENNILCFWGGNEKIYEHAYFKKFSKNTQRGYGVEIVLMVKDVEEFYNKVKNSVKVVEPLKTKAWGLKDFRIEDPFGFYLRVTSQHNILDSKYAVP